MITKQLQAKKSELEQAFVTLEKRKKEIEVEQYRLQGEFRLVDSLLKPKEKK